MSQKLEELYRTKIHVNRCPYCNSKKFHKHGAYRFTVRYKCQNCKKTFIPSTGTSLHHLHKKETFIEYSKVIRDEGLLTIRELAKRFNISTLTAFDWRHKILVSVPQINKEFNNSIFCYPIEFYFSQKGRRNLPFGRKTGGQGIKKDNAFQTKTVSIKSDNILKMQVATVGKESADLFLRVFGEKRRNDLKIVLGENSKSNNFYQVINNHNVSIKSIDLKSKNRDAEELKKLQNFANDIKSYINKILRGVSTKYLQLYINFLVKNIKGRVDAMSKRSLSMKHVWSIFSQLEVIYEFFIYRNTIMCLFSSTKRLWKTSTKYYATNLQFPIYVD